MTQQPVVQIENLRVGFGGPQYAIESLSFALHAGKTLAIVGESGSGKSLTALALMGLIPKSAQWSGDIRLLGEGSVYSLGPETSQIIWQSMRRNVVGMVFQEPMSALNPLMSVGKQLAEAVTAHGGGDAKSTALKWLEKVQLPDPARTYSKFPHELSGGQKQRVMIAMAMCGNPALLIADEPTTALDATVQQEIVALMKELQRDTGTAMIFITHDLGLAAGISDDVLVMRNGNIVEYGATEDVLGNPQAAYTKALLACRPRAGSRGYRLPVVADFLDGSGPSHQPELPQHKISAQVLLKVRNLRVWFTSGGGMLGGEQHVLRAVEDVSFDLHAGESLGLVGESGCGKSTVSRALMGLQPIESGQMRFEDIDLAHLTAGGWRRMRREVQMIFQDPFASLNPRMTVGDAIREPLRYHGIVPKSEVEAEAARLLHLVELPANSLDRYPHQFSGGQRQRIGIARALALRPKLLICDESVSALDVSVQARILNLLKELQQELKLSYLFISHDLNVVHYMADQVLVMQKGHIVERGKAEDVLRRPEHEYTQRLVAAIP
jgi:peptide/nickel transport system ATP-binding protein